MSAIFGQINFCASAIDPIQFKLALDKSLQYGPDRSGMEIVDSIGVGYHALYIAQGSKGKPLIHRSANLIVIADAILDDRADLEDLLCNPEENARDLSDTELIYRSFTKWGENCVHFLYGDYAFAAISLDRNEVFLARDHIGTRPLFWARRDDSFIFGTSVESIVGISAYGWNIDEHVVAEQLMFPNRPLSKSLFSQIYFVPAGGAIVANNNKIRRNIWWNPNTKVDPRYLDIQRARQTCRDLVGKAVSNRVNSLRPVGSHLSGGLDSTTVTIIAADELKKRGEHLIGAYCWAPAEKTQFPVEHQLDERRLTREIGVRHNFKVVYGSANSDQWIEFIDRPMEFENIANLVDELPILASANADNVGVMLSGWGGDEVYSSHGAGYIGYLLSRGRISAAKKFSHNFYPPLRNLKTIITLLWRELLHPMLPRTFYFWFDPRDESRRRRTFISKKLRKRYRHLIANRLERGKFGLHPNRNSKRYIQFGHTTMRMETWAAWSARYGFQYRYPLTDRKLLEFLLTVPPETMYSSDRPRELAQSTFADILPKNLSKRDVANEKLRSKTRENTWLILKTQADAGKFDDNCPWIDSEAFRDAATSPALPQNDAHSARLFLDVIEAARIWSLFRRAKKNRWE